VLLAKVAGVIKALPARAAALFQAPLVNAALLAKALEEKVAAGSPTVAATAETVPAAESEATVTPEASVTAEAPATAEPPTAETPATETPAEPAE
jgi:large subunit ribosomal protein L10